MQIFYKEFYQKALLPIGKKDQQTLESKSSATHCLIAVEGYEDSKKKGYYHWRVTVYPASSDGNFKSSKPFFSSDQYVTFTDAMEGAKQFMEDGENDQLLSKYLH
ncbi:hypothetical protein ACE38V_09255 [Cytobacillus sp. Hz8]|uniref:hypothetical protein n=1 Tax=Cytobacillus sp. Hz8 TaxID=3347168 RepID=UPI0035DB5776